MKLKQKVLFFLTLLFVLAPVANSANIENIEAIDSKNVNVTFSPDVFLDPEFGFDGDLKVLKDNEISFSSKDFEDANKVILSLSDELTENSSYSLISIFGAEGSAEFEVGEEIVGYEKTFDISGQGIIKVFVKDEFNIELTFNEELSNEEFEFKLLKEIRVENTEVTGTNNAKVITKDQLEKLSNYIMIVISMRDASGTEITFNEDLYNFSTPVDLESKEGDNERDEFRDQLESSLENELGNTALNAGETPDTGAETWVLVALTILAQAVFFTRRKILK